MTTGTSSGNSSRTERSEEQIEDSVEVGYEESMATEDFRKHTPNEVWLVTEYCKPRRLKKHTPNGFGWSPSCAKVLTGNEDTHAK